MRVKSLILIAFTFFSCAFLSQEKEKFVVEKPFAVGVGWCDFSTPLRFRYKYYYPVPDNINLRYRFSKNWTLRTGVDYILYYKKTTLWSLNSFAGAERNFFLTKKSRESGLSRLYTCGQVSYLVQGHPLGSWRNAKLLYFGVGYEYAFSQHFSLRTELGIGGGNFSTNYFVYHTYLGGATKEYKIRREWLLHWTRGLSLELNYNFGLRKKQSGK